MFKTISEGWRHLRRDMKERRRTVLGLSLAALQGELQYAATEEDKERLRSEIGRINAKLNKMGPQ